MDVHTKLQRSYNMSRIRSKNTKPETIIFDLLRLKKVRFKKHYPIPGKPDIAFPKLKIAVFIDGEFWHGKDFTEWKAIISPFWLEKISKNISRDKKNRKILRSEGWKILRLWGRNIIKNPDNAYHKIARLLEKNLA